MAPSTVVAASTAVFINGGLYGQVKSIRWHPSTPYRSAHGIDAVEPFDLIPGAVEVTGELGVWRTRLDGGAQGASIGFGFADIPKGKFFTLQLKDIITQTVLFQAQYCVLLDESWGTEAQRTVEGQMVFKGLGWRNEIPRTALGQE